MRIFHSARKHGISDDDMRHAIYNAIAGLEDDDISMLFGADRAGICSKSAWWTYTRATR